MAKALRVRREDFATQVDEIWEKALYEVIRAAAFAELDPDEAAEELEYYATLREAFEIRTQTTANRK